jgi:hypothetical protein
MIEGVIANDWHEVGVRDAIVMQDAEKALWQAVFIRSPRYL